MANSFVIYTLGDTQTFQSMLNAVALIFSSPMFHGGGSFGMGYGAFTGALFLLLIMVYKASFEQKLDIKILIGPLIFYILLTVPKTTVIVEDIYNKEPNKVISNIPIGLALPLNITSSVAYMFAQQMETAYSSPNSARMLTEGLSSPLKTLYALRYVNIDSQNPYLSNFVKQTYVTCALSNGAFNVDEYQGSSNGYQYFLNFLSTKATGLVDIVGVDGSHNLQSCRDAAQVLDGAMQAFVDGSSNGQGDFLTNNLKAAVAGAKLTLDKDSSPQQIKSPSEIFEDFGKITNLTEDDGRQFVLNSLFNQPLASVSYCQRKGIDPLQNAAQCASWVQAEYQQGEDNAAGASAFLKVMQDGQNILIIIAILMFPLIVLLIMFMGINSMKLVGSYITYLASTYLWLPLATIVNYFVILRIQSSMQTFTGSSSGSLFSITDYPLFYESISNSLSLANGLMATLPVFSMMFFSGMTMGAVSLLKRMNVGNSKFYKADVNAPDFKAAIPLSNTSSVYSSTGLAAMHRTDGGNAFTSTYSQVTKSTLSTLNGLSQQIQENKGKARAINDELSHRTGISLTGSQRNEDQYNIRGKEHLQNLQGNTVAQTGTVADSSKVYSGNNRELRVDQADTAEKRELNNISLNAQAGISLGKGSNAATTPNDPNEENPALGKALSKMGNVEEVRGKIYGFAQVSGQLKTIIAGAASGVASTDSDGENLKKVPLGVGGSLDTSFNHESGKILNEESTKQIVGGTSQNYEASLTGERSSSMNLRNMSSAQLTHMLSVIDSETKSTEKSYSEMVSASFGTSLMASDSLNRIADNSNIRNELSALDNKYANSSPAEWQQAKEEARGLLRGSNVGINSETNPAQFENLVTFYAAVALGGTAAQEGIKAMTGIDAPNIDQVVKPDLAVAMQADEIKRLVEHELALGKKVLGDYKDVADVAPLLAAAIAKNNWRLDEPMDAEKLNILLSDDMKATAARLGLTPEQIAKSFNDGAPDFVTQPLQNTVVPSNPVKGASKPIKVAPASSKSLPNSQAFSGGKGKGKGGGQWQSAAALRGLKLKSGESSGGGGQWSYTTEFAQRVQSEFGNKLVRFSAVNDEWHHVHRKTSQHVKGKAFDFSIRGMDSGKAEQFVKQLAKKYGYNVSTLDEYKHSTGGTGGHIHVTVHGYLKGNNFSSVPATAFDVKSFIPEQFKYDKMSKVTEASARAIVNEVAAKGFDSLNRHANDAGVAIVYAKDGKVTGTEVIDKKKYDLAMEQKGATLVSLFSAVGEIAKQQLNATSDDVMQNMSKLESTLNKNLEEQKVGDQNAGFADKKFTDPNPSNKDNDSSAVNDPAQNKQHKVTSEEIKQFHSERQHFENLQNLAIDQLIDQMLAAPPHQFDQKKWDEIIRLRGDLSYEAANMVKDGFNSAMDKVDHLAERLKAAGVPEVLVDNRLFTMVTHASNIQLESARDLTAVIQRTFNSDLMNEREAEKANLPNATFTDKHPTLAAYRDMAHSVLGGAVAMVYDSTQILAGNSDGKTNTIKSEVLPVISDLESGAVRKILEIANSDTGQAIGGFIDKVKDSDIMRGLHYADDKLSDLQSDVKDYVKEKALDGVNAAFMDQVMRHAPEAIKEPAPAVANGNDNMATVTSNDTPVKRQVLDFFLNVGHDDVHQYGANTVAGDPVAGENANQNNNIEKENK